MTHHPVSNALSACSLCSDRFAATATAHQPNPVVWFQSRAKVLIASQAPGMKVHQANTPFWDASGDRLRAWMEMDKDTFYDRSRIAIVPMAFCFPGYDAKGSDLPPPPLCAKTWRAPILKGLEGVELTLLIGGFAQKWHLGLAARKGVTETVRAWREHAPSVYPLPHPSWRNTAWLKKNPWFEADVLPSLRTRLKEVLA